MLPSIYSKIVWRLVLLRKKILSLLAVVAMLVTILPISALAAFADTGDHWANASIEKWREYGVIQGDGGNFRPDDPITRGELAVILDRVMNYQANAENTYPDLGHAFYTDAMLKALKAGVLTDYGSTACPLEEITREEAAITLARVLGVTGSTTPSGFDDSDAFSPDAAVYINALVEKGIVHGSGGDFNPQKNLTRAEAMTLLDNAIGGLFDTAGEFTGTVDGTAIINTDGVILKDMTINGDLIISEGVANGDVTLQDVTVTGRTIVRGGGADSIHIAGNSHLTSVIIEKADDGSIRVVTEDGAVVDAVYIDDGKDDIILTGSFKSVIIAAAVTVNAVNARIEAVSVTGDSAVFNLDAQSTVGTLTADVQMTLNNSGTITKAEINADNITLSGNKPQKIVYGDGIQGGSTSGGGVYVPPAITITNLNYANGSTITFISSVAGATIKFNDIRIKNGNDNRLTVSGTNTITVPLMTSGSTNTLTIEKSGYTTSNSTIVYTAPFNATATLGEWNTDRTEPKSWSIEDGWITLETKTEPNNSWHAWQGNKSATGMGLTTDWMVETQLELTEDMVTRDGIRASVWLQVEGIEDFGVQQKGVIDWAILQFKKDSATDVAGWQAWNSAEPGSWIDLDDSIATTAGIYTLTMVYESGTLYQYIDGVLVNQYDINTEDAISAPTNIIIQSYSFGESYTAKWTVPTVKYLNLYPADAIYITSGEDLTAAISGQADGQTWVVGSGTYDLPRDQETKRDNAGTVVTTGGQVGWYFPIAASGISIIGHHNPVITSSETSTNGAWASQNLITIWGDQVTLQGLVIEPKVTENKSVEVVGDVEFTAQNCTFRPNTVAAGANGAYGGSLYFNGKGTTGTKSICIDNNIFDYAIIAFDGVEGSFVNIRGNTFTNVAPGYYAIGNTYWGSSDRITTQYTDINISGNSFNVNEGGYVIAARLNETFILSADNTLNGSPIDKNNFDTYINFNNLAYWQACKDNKVFVDDVLYESPYKNVDTYVSTSTQLTAAVSAAQDSDTIALGAGTYELDTQLVISKPLTLLGIGTVTIKPSASFTGAASYENNLISINGVDGLIKLENLTVQDALRSGICAYESTDVQLENVILQNNAAAGLIVNGSGVTASSLTTNGNAWGAVNVDPGSGVTTDSIFIIDSASILTEETQIWSDGANVDDGTPAVTVNAPANYTKYAIGGTDDGFLWSNKPVGFTIDMTVYSNVTDALAAAAAGDIIMANNDINLSNSLVIDKAVTLDGNGHTVNQTVKVTADGTIIKNLTGTVNTRSVHGLSGVGSATAFFVDAKDVVLDTITVDGSSYLPTTESSVSIAVIGWKGAEFTVQDSNIKNVTTGIFAHLGYTDTDFTNILSATGNSFENVWAGIGGTQTTTLTATGNTFVSVQDGGEGIGLGDGITVAGSSGDDVAYLEDNNTFFIPDENEAKVRDYRNL